MKTVLGIDLGTQSLKLVAYDYESRVIVDSQAAPLDVRTDVDGTAEQSADAWIEALQHALGKLDRHVRKSIQAIAVSGQQHGFVALDAAGKVLSPVKLWCDTSTQFEVDEITRACGGRDACIELSGNPMLTGYTAPKIRWLRNRHPERYRSLAHIALPHDFLNYVLTGVHAMEFGDASGTGLLDVRRRCWSRHMLDAVDAERDLASCLPPLIAAGESIGTTNAAAESLFGLPPGIPVATGGGDNMMAAIGTGNVVPGRLTMSLGTSGTVFAYSDAPVVDVDGNIAAFCSSTGGWLPLLCTLNCTSATELVRAMTNVGLDDFDSVVGAVSAGCNGLTVLPFFAGERTPNLPDARAELLGLSAHNASAGHLLRATVEGVTFSLRFGVEELRRLGVATEEIVVTGGGARSRQWRQIVADICDLPVVALALDEGACFGAALQALWHLERRVQPDLSISEVTVAHVRYAERTLPDPGCASVYAQAWQRYRQAVDRAASHGPFERAVI